MSKIGNTPIIIPDSVTLTLTDGHLTVSGPKGELAYTLPAPISATRQENKLTLSAQGDSIKTRSLHGLARSLVANLITGVTVGYQKTLELVGTGYRVVKQKDQLILSLGFSHPVEVLPSPGISFEVEGNTIIKVSGLDKQLVGHTAAKIRSLKKPEPYKGKGIRYQGEVVRRKAGKAAKVGTGE